MGINILHKKLKNIPILGFPKLSHWNRFNQNDTFLIYNFLYKFEYYTLNGFPKTINLTLIIDTKLFHQNMEQTILGFLKSASNTLNNHKCGVKS